MLSSESFPLKSFLFRLILVKFFLERDTIILYCIYCLHIYLYPYLYVKIVLINSDLLTNSFRRKFGFNLAQTWLWCKTMAIRPMIEPLYEKGSRYSRGSTYLLVNNHSQKSFYPGKKDLGVLIC